ncbi:MAG: hypothetical protein K2Q07_04695 [Burkholderiaceae bacterium]|nr:hypothetical protein [Burkholderiaceae bacterium]
MPLLFCLFALVLVALSWLVEAGLTLAVVLSLTATGFALAGFWLSARRDRRGLLLAAWSLIVLYLLNYQMQFFLVAYMYQSPDYEGLLRMLTIKPIVTSEEIQLRALRLLTLGFVLMCGALCGWLQWRGRTRRATPAAVLALGASSARGQQERRPLLILLLLALVTIGVGLPLQMLFNIGSLTNTDAAMGYRLGGVVYHALVTLSPLLLLAIHVRALHHGMTFLSRASLAVYFLLALVESTMMSSRGYVVLQMLQVILLYAWLGVSRRRAVGFALATVAFGLLLYPLMTSVRNLRSNLGYSTLDSVTMAFAAHEESDPVASALLMASRFIGYTSFLTSLHYGGENFDFEQINLVKTVTLRESGFTRWYTESVAGFGSGVRGHLSAPGLLGAGFVLGGVGLTVLLPALFALLCQGVFEWMAARAWRLGPVAPLAVFTVFLFLFNEGTFDLSWLKLVLTAGSLLVLTPLFGWMLPRRQAV